MSVNDLAHLQKDRCRDRETKRLRGLRVDGELELRRSLDRGVDLQLSAVPRCSRHGGVSNAISLSAHVARVP
jgi:hypothetical protein